MVRRYRPDPVDPAAVARIVDAATRGPSAGWSQGVRFVVVTDAQRRGEIARYCREEQFVERGFDPWLSVAPVHVVIGVRPDDYRARYAEPDKRRSRGPARWHAPFWWVDAGAALSLLLLAAVDEGLGAGFLDVADPDAVRRLLSIPQEVEIVGLATLGHADGDQPSGSVATRRRREDLVHWEMWTA
jgi:nitroreductase